VAKADSGIRTEKPTPRRRREARQEGQIARSPDLVQWIALLAATFVLPATVSAAMGRLDSTTRQLLEVSASGHPGATYGRLGEMLWIMVVSLAPLFGLLVLVTAGGLALQGGITLAPKALLPKWERISPKAGFKRLFSAESLMETAKAVTRLAVFAVVIWVVVMGAIRPLLSGAPVELASAGSMLGGALLLALRVAAVAGIVVGVADYFFQRHMMERRLMMSKYDIHQEMKSTEGDPVVRGRRRVAHRKLSRNAVLSAVDDASVVVVNPTHVAVALRYRDGAGAPQVVAKGGDEVARRIRERAIASGVPVVEARSLARVLFDTVKVGDHIPPELFEAVAIVLAFVMRDRRPRWGRGVRSLRVPVPPGASR
jgi:flagellar biosynthetic protein FlhB